MRHFRGFGPDHLSRGVRGAHFRRMPSPKRLIALARSTVTTALSEKKLGRHFAKSEHGTLTLLGTIPKAIRRQCFRFVTLTRLAPKNNLLQTRLLVRRVCEDEISRLWA